MPDAFVPFAPPVPPVKDATFSPFQLPAQAAVSTQPLSATAKPTLIVHGTADNCAQPSITLQRSGDTVTAIRIQCRCGQVIELNCVY